MALRYEEVIAVISHPPNSRKEFEVLNLLPWFRKKSDIFRNLKQDLLVDLVKHMKFVTKVRDDIIIRQGDIGDCMYILLRGQVTIYIRYGKDDPGGASNNNDQPVRTNPGENLRQQLGTFVCHLGPGEVFGEVALHKEDDSVRTASIIANDTVDLIEINRELYNRSVRSVLQKEFEDKTNFISYNRYFGAWVPRYRKQLAMAFQKEIYPYDSVLIRQGESVERVLFILSGEVKITADPAQHRSQYPKMFEKMDKIKTTTEDSTEESNHLMEQLSKFSLRSTPEKEHSASSTSAHSRLKNKATKKQLIELSLIGVNEAIGDMEMLLDLHTSICTAVCTQRTEVLVLEAKHYDRLLAKRNSGTVESMRRDLLHKLARLQMNKQVRDTVPLLTGLCQHIERGERLRQDQIRHAANANNADKNSKHSRTPAELFQSFIPPPGPVIDLFGPGTVFYRIRERERARIARNPSLAKKPAVQQVASLESGHSAKPWYDNEQSKGNPLTSDPALANLESRLKVWMTGTGNPSPRVAKLHRTQVENN